MNRAALPKAGALPDCATPRAAATLGEIAFSGVDRKAPKQEQIVENRTIATQLPSHTDATRALVQHLEDLNTQLKLLPLHSRLRIPLITRIRDIEDQIGWVEGL